MDLRWPWVVVVAAVVVLAAMAWWTGWAWLARRSRRRTPPAAVVVAHAARLRRLPRYRVLRRRQLVLAVVLTAGALTALAGSALVAARPQETQVVSSVRERDVMLCLDASASMDRWNAEVTAQMRRVVGSLSGARVGLTLFSGAAVTVVPLTDDLAYVADQLELARRSFAEKTYAFVAGVDLDRKQRASLLGDGLVSCVERFDRTDEDRARSVLVATDNDPLGTPVYSVAQAARRAAERGVVVHAVAAPSTTASAARELEDGAAATGGSYAVLPPDGSADAVVDRIERQEARRTEVPPRVVSVDTEGPGSAVAAAGVGLLGLGWTAQAVLAARRRRSR